MSQSKGPAQPPSTAPVPSPPERTPAVERPRELGGPPGPDPTRFGDWEKNGRCIDF
ncbi:MAG TPA: DUF1674 domain-containing protein [Steroidobacteraceae bacterium]|nr:DUF1674 domain-containing protein [Steroidobacteraceae bacterium]